MLTQMCNVAIAQVLDDVLQMQCLSVVFGLMVYMVEKTVIT